MTKELTPIDHAKKLIINNERAFEAVLPKNFPVDKFIATFCLEVQKNPKLAHCTNLIEVARDVANFGLVIGGLAQQSHLIPFDKKKKIGNEWVTETIAQLIIGYRGYITKLEEAGYVVEVEVVTNDEVNAGFFEEIRGSETKIIHRPIRRGIRDRESIALAYCVIKGKDSIPVVSVLSKEEIEEMAKTEKWIGEGKDKKKERALGNVWTQDQRETDYAQMCMKTVIRNCVKRVNLKIVNEMSAYEGKRDAEIMKDITLVSKTASLHTPPANLEKAFDISMKEVREKDVVQTDLEDFTSDIKLVEPTQEEKDEKIFAELKEYITAAGFKTTKAIDMFLNVTHKDQIDSISDVVLRTEILSLANLQKEKLK